MDNEKPFCYGWADSNDPSCIRCKIYAPCSSERDANKPECYGAMHDDCVECTACLLESQCIDSILKKETSVTKRSVRIRRSKVGAKPPVIEKPVEESVVEEEDELVAEQELEQELPVEDAVESEELVVDYAGKTITELRDLCTSRDVSSVGRKSVLIKRLREHDDQFGMTEDVEAEVEIEAGEVAVPVDVAKSSPVANVTGLLVELDAVLSALRNGEVLNITKIGGGMYMLSHGSADALPDAPPAGVSGKPLVPVLKGMAWRREVQTAEHFGWMYEDTGNGKSWKEMTTDEKYAFAEEIEAKWEEHETERVDVIRMVQAVKNKVGLVMYKPEYQDRSVRNALRGR